MEVGRRRFIGSAALISAAGLAGGARAGEPERLVATSPDGAVTIAVHPDPRRLRWSVTHAAGVVVEPSPLGLVLPDGAILGEHARLVSTSRASHRGDWRPPFGVRDRYPADYEEVTATFADDRRGISFAVIARAYDQGAAIRYRLLDAPGGAIELAGEATHFRLPADALVTASRDEGQYQTVPQSRIAPEPDPPLTASSDHKALADVPMTVSLPGGLTAMIGESDRLHYPRLMLLSADGGVATYLMTYPGRATGYSGPGDTPPERRFRVETPFETPWRLVAIGRTPVELLATQGFTETLATPNRLGDTGWILPGKAYRIPKPYTLENALACIDFAARRRLDYVEIDAHWYGDGTDPGDATVPIAGFPVPRIIDYARSKGLGMILYVDRVPAMRQLDAVIATYRRWGVAGIKFGFVWEGRQSDNDFIYDMVRKCGENHLLVNLHDDLRPAGLERTLPNYITLEGVRGNEHFPTARHNVTLPFVRALAGPSDYTICYANPKNRTTNAHQLAIAVICYMPLAFLYWYDSPAKYDGRAWPELAFLDECPTVWDETVPIAGEIGSHVAIARRSGSRWFVGAMTDESPRTLDLPLGFLSGGSWRVRRFADGVPAAEPAATPVVVDEIRVCAGETVRLDLAPSGGQALIIEPA